MAQRSPDYGKLNKLRQTRSLFVCELIQVIKVDKMILFVHKLTLVRSDTFEIT